MTGRGVMTMLMGQGARHLVRKSRRRKRKGRKKNIFRSGRRR